VTDLRFQRWCDAADAIRATTKRLEKSAVLEAYLPTLDDASLALAARFFSGVPFPRHDMRTTQVGGRIVSDALAAVTGRDPGELHERVIALGDLGDLAREALAGRAPSGATLADVEAGFARLAAAQGTNARRALVREWLGALGAAEAQYVVKLLLGSGELRIGLKEAQVEEALARAYGRPLALVRHANLLRGDVGEVSRARPARPPRRREPRALPPDRLHARAAARDAEEIAAALPAPFAVEDKYDGIRAQAHVGTTPRARHASRCTRARWTRSRTATRRWRPRWASCWGAGSRADRGVAAPSSRLPVP
jgi:DNA ligase-1